VWLHGTTTGGGASYCVNPGALAYGFTTIYEQILVSASGAACDAGANVKVTWWANPFSGNNLVTVPYNCVDGSTATAYSSQYQSYEDVDGIANACNVRIWLHGNVDGSGGSYCVSPGANVQGIFDPSQLPYLQVSISGTPNCMASPHPTPASIHPAEHVITRFAPKYHVCM
jgi:hypothetical protein